VKFFRIALVGLFLFLLSLPSLAQDTETAEWGNFGLLFDYPSDWEMDDSGESALLVLCEFECDEVFSGGGGMAIYFYEPRTEDSAEEAIEALVGDELNDDFDFGDIEETEIMGLEAFMVSYESDGFSGFSLAFDYDGEVLLLDAGVADDNLSNREEDTLLEIVNTMHEGEGNNNTSNGGGDVIETAQDEDASGEDIVEELIDLGLVSEDGDFLFEEDEIDEGVFDFAEGYEGGNVVMAGWLSIELAEDDEDYRYCTFIAKSTTDDPEDSEGVMLIVGFDSIGDLMAYEYDIEDEDNSSFEDFDAGVDADEENHVLMIVQDDELSVFVNGEEIVSGWELIATAGDDELFTGFVVGDGCSMTNVWAYSFE
jgi:hypothetical protein